MKLKVNKDSCTIVENEVWNVGDYNVHTVEVELSNDFDGLVNKVRYFVGEYCYDMLITNNVAQVPIEATQNEEVIEIGVYGFDADTEMLVQSTRPVQKYITKGTYTGEPENVEPLTPTDKEQMETAIQANTNAILSKQDILVNGENIKTINHQSILGEGNIDIEGMGTTNYNELENKPSVNNVILQGNKTLNQLGIQPAGNYALRSEIPDVSNFITNTVDDLVNYYKKSETYTQSQINDMISAITTLNLKVVQTLPTEDISTTTIYLVPKTTAETNNIYDEYIYVSNAWEHIGSTQADLTNYYTKTQVDGKINCTIDGTIYTTVQSVINEMINQIGYSLEQKQNAIDSSHKLSSDLVDDTNHTNKFVTSSDITNWNGKADASHFVTLTQTEYDNLQTKDPNTYYFIEEE